jgi:hypothetical protein
MPREFARQEDLSIFGDTINGVPNPLVPHTHPYPTRFHGPIFNQPQAMQPYVERPYGLSPFTGVGADAVDPSVAAPPAPAPGGFTLPPMSPLWKAVSAASAAACVYHGYKRNNSVGWALWWGIMGSMAPVIAPAIAVAQGFGKPAKGSR